jgi:hypothetical protein
MSSLDAIRKRGLYAKYHPYAQSKVQLPKRDAEAERKLFEAFYCSEDEEEEEVVQIPEEELEGEKTEKDENLCCRDCSCYDPKGLIAVCSDCLQTKCDCEFPGIFLYKEVCHECYKAACEVCGKAAGVLVVQCATCKEHRGMDKECKNGHKASSKDHIVCMQGSCSEGCDYDFINIAADEVAEDMAKELS